jgi:hypothetical protein
MMAARLVSLSEQKESELRKRNGGKRRGRNGVQGAEGWRMEVKVSWACGGVDARSDVFDPVRSVCGSGECLTTGFLPGIPNNVEP